MSFYREFLLYNFIALFYYDISIIFWITFYFQTSLYIRLHIKHHNIYDKHKQLKQLQIINNKRNIITSYTDQEPFSKEAVIESRYLLHNIKFVF